MALITLKSTSEITLLFLMTRTLDLNIVDIVGIRMELLVHGGEGVLQMMKKIDPTGSKVL